jgi:hypothetical protein
MNNYYSFCHYICGLVDGEGSFSISIQSDKTHKNGYRLKPAFSIGLHKDDKDILLEIMNFFGCGKLRPIYDILKYEVADIDSLTEKIIPFFKTYQLRAKKKTDFEIFEAICHLIKNKIHLTNEGFKNILTLRSKMNIVGQRRRNFAGGVAQLVNSPTLNLL